MQVASGKWEVKLSSVFSKIQRGKKGTTKLHAFSLLTQNSILFLSPRFLCSHFPNQIWITKSNTFKNHSSLIPFFSLCCLLLCMAIAAAAVVLPLGLLFFASGLLVNLIQVSLFPLSLLYLFFSLRCIQNFSFLHIIMQTGGSTNISQLFLNSFTTFLLMEWKNYFQHFVTEKW